MATIKDLSESDIANIKARISRGDKYSDIASDYRLNQGRIADFKFGRIRDDVRPSRLGPEEIPAPEGVRQVQLSLFGGES